MNTETRYKELVDKALKLRDELLQMEKDFNEKKEEFLRLQGAISVLEEMQTGVAKDSWLCYSTCVGGWPTAHSVAQNQHIVVRH